MTIKIPADNTLDKILKFLGKKRKIIFPPNVGDIYKQMGPYVQIKARKENFFRALFRKNSKTS